MPRGCETVLLFRVSVERTNDPDGKLTEPRPSAILLLLLSGNVPTLKDFISKTLGLANARMFCDGTTFNREPPAHDDSAGRMAPVDTFPSSTFNRLLAEISGRIRTAFKSLGVTEQCIASVTLDNITVDSETGC